MEFPVCIGGAVELRGRDLAGGGRLFFGRAALTRPLLLVLLVLGGFTLLLVFDLSKAISVSRWSFRSSKARTCSRKALFSVFRRTSRSSTRCRRESTSTLVAKATGCTVRHLSQESPTEHRQ